MESTGAGWSKESELQLEELLLGPSLSEELKRQKTRITKEILNDVISKTDKPFSKSEIFWQLLLQLDLYVGRDSPSDLEQSGTSVTSQIESQLDWNGVLSTIDEKIAEHSSEPSRESTLQNDESKKQKTRISKEMINDVISKANKPLSKGEVLWRLMLQLDLNACSRNLEQSGTSVTSQIESQLDSNSVLSAIDEQIAEHSNEPSRESLLSRKSRLEKELKEWNDWGTQKVMQAAERLNKDRGELKSLRQQERTRQLMGVLDGSKYSPQRQDKKNRQLMEIVSREHASLMEANIARLKGLEDKARKLETSNDQLRMELKDLKLHAAEEEANSEKASRRMEENLKKLQSYEEEKLLFRDELAAEKRRVYQLQKQLEQARVLRDNMKSLRQKEERLKNEALHMVKIERKEREQIEMSVKSQENALKIEAENNLQRYQNDILQLKNQIAELESVQSSSSKICLSEVESNSELKRGWECVMCSEIVSVVFLPCGHQVFCRKCNDKHEQYGVKDCPFCSTPIQRRVLVRFDDDP